MQLEDGYNTAPNPNKKLYNAGSEWQDDIEGLADYYSTFFREYDPMIGRFNGVDPMAELTDEVTTYAYVSNNPVMMNDPVGDFAFSNSYTIADIVFRLSMSKNGGTYSSRWGFDFSSSTFFDDDNEGGGGGGGPKFELGPRGRIGQGSFQQKVDKMEWLRRFTAVAMVESGKGNSFTDNEIIQFAWVYVNRVKYYGGFDEGFRGSSAYTGKSPDYRMFMLGLGSTEFEDDPIAKRDLRNFPFYNQRALRIMVKLFLSFTFRDNPLPPGNHLTGQGYVNDINGLEGDPVYYNTKVRQYIYLVRTGVIPNKNTVLLLWGSNPFHSDATFFYDENAIRKYFDKHPEMIKIAPLYDPVKNEFKIK